MTLYKTGGTSFALHVDHDLQSPKYPYQVPESSRTYSIRVTQLHPEQQPSPEIRIDITTQIPSLKNAPPPTGSEPNSDK